MEVHTLYKLSCFAVANNFSVFKKEILAMPALIVYDVYEKLPVCNRVSELHSQLTDVHHFTKLLEKGEKWNVLFQIVHYVSQEDPAFLSHIAKHQDQRFAADNLVSDGAVRKHFACALRLSTFFIDAGHFCNAGMALSALKDLSSRLRGNYLELQFKLWNRLLHIYTLDCKFQEAKNAFYVAGEIFKALHNGTESPGISATLHFTSASLYLFALSDYDQAYNFAVEAVKGIDWKCSVRDAIDALRQAAKACIVKRNFKPAELLVKKAVQLSRAHFGNKSPKFAESLSDFAFYLLNVDCVAASVQVYQDSLHIRQDTLGETNVLTAVGHEDLAYALYVRDYSIGVFEESRKNAEVAIDTLTKLLPPDHLLLASSKRVKALILEELAIDDREKEQSEKLLLTAEQLHLESLHLARLNFGEKNVQTAKHYGNLGRLYQSMKRYEEAERMHLKAISIKEHLLGREDYEVALSLGHLASLYNYDMRRYVDAEQLYQRSIRIGVSLFGDSYSGLEYDYRGLIYLYAQTNNYVEMARHHMILSDWEYSRRNLQAVKPMEDVGTWDSVPIAELISKINFCTLNSET